MPLDRTTREAKVPFLNLSFSLFLSLSSSRMIPFHHLLFYFSFFFFLFPVEYFPNKEMFVFHGSEEEEIALRPEGTAGLVRAAIPWLQARQGFHRYHSAGPMFRRERPQVEK